ncbi:RICIN domain-containing protein [Bacillus sp. TL12]|uniref:RICIN domain-containing protein n=1 Tax=Bacillus sp. TL12 TaxID=2894756 RepID=UPI001F51DDFF|nr:RICIN domain-containing protein [Bacillus sp. TL12]MCI0768003.1 RICIN domain-containing protein [Bacillus sp. TL12]
MSDFPIFCYYQLAISGLKLLNLKGVGKSMTFKVGMKYMFKNKNSRKYLDISGNQTGNNANVQQYEYLADAPSERFFLHPLDNNYYAMINVNSGKVIDISGNQTGNNANIQQYEWLGEAPSEYWYFHREADGHYVIESKHSGKVLDIAGNSTANNAKGYGNDSKNNPPHLKFFPFKEGTYQEI